VPLGLLWGAVYALADWLVCRRTLIRFLFPLAHPVHVYVLPGAISNTICSIPREFYINVLPCVCGARLCYWPRLDRARGGVTGVARPGPPAQVPA
jgi:hypothetical protein